MKDLIKPENAAEAYALKSLLKEHGIPAIIISFQDTAYDGIYQAQYGWGTIRVEEKDLAEAQKIVEEWKKASPDKVDWQE